MKGPPRPIGRDRWTVAALFGGALALRLSHVFAIRDHPLSRYLFLDLRYYDDWGRSIAAGNWLGESVFFQDPAYPYLLGLLYAAFGHGYAPVMLAQALLGSLIPPLVFLAARRWLQRSAALVAAVLAALYLPSVYYEGLVLKTWLATFAVALALWLLSEAIHGGRLTMWFASGLALGVGCLARGNLVLALPALALWVLLDPGALARGVDRQGGGPRSRLADRRVWAAAGSLLLGAALLLGISAVRNRAVSGYWIVTTANAGQNLYIGNNPLNTDGEYARLPFVDPSPRNEQQDFAREAERRAGRPLGPVEVSRFWAAEALQWIRANPGDWLELTRKKLLNYVRAYEIPDNRDYYVYREISPVLRLPVVGFGLLAPFAMLGAGLLIRRGGWTRALVVLTVVYSASVLLFFVFSRFRMAIMPALFVFAGYGMTELVRGIEAAIRHRRVQGVLLQLVIVGVLIAIVNLPVRGPRSLWTVRVAERLGLPVRVETTAALHFNLGVTLAEYAKQDDGQALLEMAEAELREALRQDSSLAGVHLEHGKVLARMSRNAEAIDAYGAALRIEPNRYEALMGLGILHQRRGEWSSAAGAFERAARAAPRAALARILLGETLLESGDSERAAEAFAAALRLAPDSERARRGLSRVR